MISLSSIIKSTSYITLEEARMIASKKISHSANQSELEPSPNISEETSRISEEINEAQRLSEQILRDAESTAEDLLQQAQERCTDLETQARADIEQWWSEQRANDQQWMDQSKKEGYEQGYQSGFAEAQELLEKQYEDMLKESKQILERAQQMKEQLIQEAEPFLLELSLAIAEKIIDQQVTLSQDWILGSIKKKLARRREQGLITLCVSPAHFENILNAREELMIALDSQAELQIVPDTRITDHGCVLRTSFGSVDATVGTQLQEIKAALMQIAQEQQTQQI